MVAKCETCVRDGRISEFCSREGPKNGKCNAYFEAEWSIIKRLKLEIKKLKNKVNCLEGRIK